MPGQLLCYKSKTATDKLGQWSNTQILHNLCHPTSHLFWKYFYFWMQSCLGNTDQMVHSMIIAVAPTWWLPHTFSCASQLLCQLPSSSATVQPGEYRSKAPEAMQKYMSASVCKSIIPVRKELIWCGKTGCEAVAVNCSLLFYCHLFSHCVSRSISSGLSMQSHQRPRTGYTCISLHWVLFRDFIFFVTSPSTRHLYSIRRKRSFLTALHSL